MSYLGKAGPTHIEYLKAFGIDAQDWSHDRAYTLYNYIRKGDGGLPQPQPDTNIFARAYKEKAEEWVGKNVAVKGSKKPGQKHGIRGTVLGVFPRKAIITLPKASCSRDACDPCNWLVILRLPRGVRLTGMTGIEEISPNKS